MKLARQHGVEELLPFSVKSTEYRLQRRLESGLRVKGTGVGQRVKGKEAERTMKGRYVYFIFIIFFDWGVFGMGGLGKKGGVLVGFGLGWMGLDGIGGFGRFG